MKIQSTKDISNQEKFRFMVYAYSGMGKTQLISTIPGKILVLNLDKGLKTLGGHDIDYVTANKWEDVIEFLNYIKKPECLSVYNWIVFDSVTAMTDLLYRHLENDKKFTGHEFWKHYGGFINKFMLVLRDQTDYHTLSLFEAIDKEDDSGMAIKAFGIQGQVGGRVPGFFDEVYALKMEKDNSRILQTVSSPGWIAKSRSRNIDKTGPALNKTEPADLAHIMNKIQGKK